MPTQTNGTTSREMYLRPTAFEVSSETTPGVTYRVTLPDCSCPDFRHRRTTNARDWACKHLKAAFAQAGWQLPTRDTSRLDEATARELLLDLRIDARMAGAALARSQRQTQGTIELDNGIVVIVYNRNADTYDVQLPA